MKKKILVVGDTGFVGAALVKELISLGYKVRFNQAKYSSLVNTAELRIKEWSAFLKDIDCIVNCAGKTKLSKNNYSYDKSNFYNTKILINQAILNKVKHFIHLSSISVKNVKKNILTKNKLIDNYSFSKKKAEVFLTKRSFAKKIKITILRPPLIFGPEVKGNFLLLLKWINYGLPIVEFKKNKNFIGITNLVNCIIECIKYPRFSVGTFEVADDSKITFNELIKKIYIMMKRKYIIFPIPNFFHKFYSKELVTDLLISNRNITKKIGWKPLIETKEELQKTIKWFLKKNKSFFPRLF
jgi:UDP-glucose 4-epimerase